MNDTCVDKVKCYGVKAVVSQHYALREARGATRVGDSYGCVAYVFSLNGVTVLCTLDESVPAYNSLLSVGDLSACGYLCRKLLDRRKRCRGRLNDNASLIDIRENSRYLGIRYLDNDKYLRARALYHSRDALNVHSGIYRVYRRADLIQGVERDNRLGGRC